MVIKQFWFPLTSIFCQFNQSQWEPKLFDKSPTFWVDYPVKFLDLSTLMIKKSKRVNTQ